MDGASNLDPIDEYRLRLVANAVPALLSYLGPDARYRWGNESYRRWFGRAPESLASLHLREVVGESAWAALKPYVERVLGGEEVTFEQRLVYGDGRARDIRASYVPDRDPSGRVRGFVALVSDISEVRTAERALRITDRLLAESQQAAHVGSWQFTIGDHPATSALRWSDETYRIFGYQPGSVEVDQALFYRSVHPEDRDEMRDSSALEGAPGDRYEREFRIVRPDGTVRVIHGWSHVERDAAGRPLRLLGTCQDVTEQKRAERERERALEELKEADRRKDEFLAMLSHELRNPLAPILTAIEVLRLADPVDVQTGTTFHAVIERQVLHMKRLLDDLLDVSRVNQGKIDLRRELVDLRPMLQQAVEISRPLMAEKDQRLSVMAGSTAVLVDADPVRLVQVFANLLNNAAKYSDQGASIEVLLQIEGTEAVVRVRDQGVGMSPDLLERAFDLFVQEPRSLDRAQGGMGIGLTMVRNLVNMHGGSVRAFSEGPGRGCEIVVRLPRAYGTEATPGRSSPRPVSEAARPLRVLVVDDNLDAARTLGHLLGLLGHEVRIAHDGPSALVTSAQERPELVFIDIGLPGMDGYALASALRAAGLARASLIAVTGYGRDEDLQRSSAFGFDHHLVKPIDLSALQRLPVLRGEAGA
jgi:two-component system CheB/CheR fusion protein